MQNQSGGGRFGDATRRFGERHSAQNEEGKGCVAVRKEGHAELMHEW